MPKVTDDKQDDLALTDDSFDIEDDTNDYLDFEEHKREESAITFSCPNCGEVSQDEVIFLCNKCGRDEVIYKNGVYMCPSCLEPGENFECMNCGSKEVTMKS